MLQAYLPLLLLFVFAVLIGFLVVAIGHVFGPKRPTARKAAPYEVEGDQDEVARDTAARLEAEYDTARLKTLIDSDGWAAT